MHRESIGYCREKAYERVVQELGAYDFAVSRLRHVQRRCEIETVECKTLHARIDSSIEATTESIASLKRELEAAKIERACRLEYESVALAVNKLPSRESLQG